MLTVYFTLLVAPLLVLADQELLLQIVTTNAPTALVKAAYNGLDVVYSAKFVGERRYLFGRTQEEMHGMLKNHFEQIGLRFNSSISVFMSAAPIPHKTYFLRNWSAADIISKLGKNIDTLGGPGQITTRARRVVLI